MIVKEKYGSDIDEDYDEEDSEDAESEDEDGEELTPAVDAAILRTLARIKKKDPSIYQQESAVFQGVHYQLRCCVLFIRVLLPRGTREVGGSHYFEACPQRQGPIWIFTTMTSSNDLPF